MKFVSPAFLFALSAIAVPIIIHLFNFRRYKKVYFSNIRFLKEVKQETQRKSRLKHLLVLLCRIMAVVFLSLAFAQPFIPSASSKTAAGEKAVSIYVDNSFSMDAVSKSGTLLDESKKRALEILAGYAPTDRFQLLTNDFEGKHQRLVNKEEFARMLDEVKISPSVKSIHEVFSRISDLLSKSEAARKKAFIISDFQKSTAELSKIKNDTSIEAVMIPIPAQEKSNMYIDSCWFEGPVRQLGQAEKVNVRLRNVSDRAVENNSIRLFINGQQKTPASFSMEANSQTTAVLSFASKEAGIQQCRVEINDYPVSFDDKFYFSFEVAREIPVLSINVQENNLPGTNAGSKSLSVLFSDSLFRLNSVTENSIDYASLASYNFIILNGLKSISSGLAQELQRFTSNGGSLAVFPSGDADISSYNNFLIQLRTDTYELPDTADTRVDKINFDHPLYHDVFEKRNENIDLPVVQSHFRITKSSHSGGQYLMRLQNGDAFLSQYENKKGKIYLSAVPLDPAFSNFTRHALFVPTIYKMAVYSQPVKPLFYTIGKDEVIEINNAVVSGENVFHLRSEGSLANFDIIPEHKVNDNSIDVFIHGQVREAGNYRLLLGDKVLSGISFNYDRKESNLDCFTPDELLKQKETAGLNNFSMLQAGKRPLTDALTELDQGKKLWKLCIILALAFLGGEVALLRFWKA